MKLTHTRLLVDDYKACFIFYRDVLGFEVSWEMNPPVRSI